MNDQPKPRNLRRNLLLGVGLPLVLTGALAYWAIESGADARERRSAEGALLRLDYTEVTWWDGEDHEEGYSYTYAFDADGRVVEGGDEEDAYFEPDAAYHVCYNPADPEDHDLYRLETACGQR